jgi:hypothetical protein
VGRWAQRSHRGGGPPTAAALIQIDAAQKTDDFQVDITYSGAVNPADFALADFTTLPDSGNALALGDNGPNVLQIVFDVLIDDETDLSYAGDTSGVLTPQTVTITH